MKVITLFKEHPHFLRSRDKGNNWGYPETVGLDFELLKFFKKCPPYERECVVHQEDMDLILSRLEIWWTSIILFEVDSHSPVAQSGSIS